MYLRGDPLDLLRDARVSFEQMQSSVRPGVSMTTRRAILE